MIDTKYFCDVCGKNINNELNRFTIQVGADKILSKDLCNADAQAVLDGLDVSTKTVVEKVKRQAEGTDPVSDDPLLGEPIIPPPTEEPPITEEPV